MSKFKEYLEAVATGKNAVQEAIKIISSGIKDNPKADKVKLIEKACQQTNCNPRQGEFLMNKFNEAFPSSMKVPNDDHVSAEIKAKIKNAKTTEEAVDIALGEFKEPDDAEAYVASIRRKK